MNELFQLCREALQSETIASLFIALCAFLVAVVLRYELHRWKSLFKFLEIVLKTKENEAYPKKTKAKTDSSHAPLWFGLGMMVGFFAAKISHLYI